MNKFVVSAVAGVSLFAASVFAGPTTAPASLLDAIRAGDWAVIPQKLKLQSASAGALVEPDQGKVASWIDDYRQNEERFAAERQKSFNNAVRDAKALQAGGYTDLALDGVADCYTLASNKNAFVQEKWVQQLRNDSIAAADKAAAAAEWLKARRIYSNLSVLEPTEPKWTHLSKDMFRRITILTRYAPQSFADVLHKELVYRKAARKYLTATTQPATTQPTNGVAAATTQPEEKIESQDQITQNLKSDWKTDLNGIDMEMLREALQDARLNYYKDINYGQLLNGGLSAMRLFATTAGMEKTFAALGDPAKKQAFLDVIDEQSKLVSAKPADRDMLASVLNVISAANLQTLSLPDEVLVSEFADGAFGTLDPFSSMIWPSDMEEFRTSTQGEFSGVGIQIQEVDGQIKVVSPLEDSPALRAGIRAGDFITKIDGKSAKGITTLQAKRMITGPTGTDVILTIKSGPDKVTDYTLTRQTIKVASIKGWMHQPSGGWDYMVDEDSKIAYVRLTNFTKESSNELDRAIEEIRKDGARAIVLDLRGDPGGLLTAATEVADKFLTSGKIVSTQSLRDGDLSPDSPINAHKSDDDVQLPMVVLVNQYSASASEIVSGALRDLKRATIVGERTFGKGSVQMLFPLDKQQAFLKLTTNHYYLPNGKCIHREENSTEWGVDPDLKVELTPEQMRKMIDDRTDLDILRDASAPEADQKKTAAKLLKDDLQLDAALFVLRLQLAGSPAT